jgi:hypothetical protein
LASPRLPVKKKFGIVPLMEKIVTIPIETSIAIISTYFLGKDDMFVIVHCLYC